MHSQRSAGYAEAEAVLGPATATGLALLNGEPANGVQVN